VESLLGRSEGPGLAWRFALPRELESGAPLGRAKILRSVVALANSAPGPLAHVVYGVHDNGFQRRPVGIKGRWNEATFREWARELFEPVPRFRYHEVEIDRNVLAVFEVVASAEAPHVARASLAGHVHEGQVWLRDGVVERPAIAAELWRIFTARAPLELDDEADPAWSEAAAELAAAGWRVDLVPIADLGGALADGGWPLRRPVGAGEIRVRDRDGGWRVAVVR